ncbi:hypothetical protein BDF22DRAFT_658184 [Syncephalis plumigaleata]|nr:hypothetical protein BDF22DRAFT_658184 [Syncephalis plumigaleata]
MRLDNRNNNNNIGNSGNNTHSNVTEVHPSQSKKPVNNSMNSNFTSLSLPAAVHLLKPKQAGNIFSTQNIKKIELTTSELPQSSLPSVSTGLTSNSDPPPPPPPQQQKLRALVHLVKLPIECRNQSILLFVYHLTMPLIMTRILILTTTSELYFVT